MPWSARTVDGQTEYTRPLGAVELNFFWDMQFSGTANCVEHAVVEGELEEDALFTGANVERAWRTLKTCYPLLSASLEEKTDSDEVLMVVRDGKQAQLAINEVRFVTINCADEADSYIRKVLDARSLLSKNLVSRLDILICRDAPALTHVCIYMAHLIGDAISLTNLLRPFLDILTTPHVEYCPNLLERLDMALASDDPIRTMRPLSPRQRFRKAIAKVIVNNRSPKYRGGFTLPRKLGSDSDFKPGRTDWRQLSLSERTSALVVDCCRRRGIKFGHALPVLGQIALARVWYRRYLRGQVSEEEWQARQTQPMHTGGPINLRPFLDPEWYQKGGAGEFCNNINYFYLTLPYVPTSPRWPYAQVVPPFHVLLSPGRFFLRCRIIKTQIQEWLRHPLFLEICEAYAPLRLHKAKGLATHFRAGQLAPRHAFADDLDTFAAFSQSSIGNMESLVRSSYPLKDSDPLASRNGVQHALQAKLLSRVVSSASHCRPSLRVLSASNYLRPRPSQFYLTANTANHQLHFVIYFDGNVYQPDVVDEWIREIADATRWYLGTEALEMPDVRL